MFSGLGDETDTTKFLFVGSLSCSVKILGGYLNTNNDRFLHYIPTLSFIIDLALIPVESLHLENQIKT
jgi:hypothetical protein